MPKDIIQKLSGWFISDNYLNMFALSMFINNELYSNLSIEFMLSLSHRFIYNSHFPIAMSKASFITLIECVTSRKTIVLITYTGMYNCTYIEI